MLPFERQANRVGQKLLIGNDFGQKQAQVAYALHAQVRLDISRARLLVEDVRRLEKQKAWSSQIVAFSVGAGRCAEFRVGEPMRRDARVNDHWESLSRPGI